MVKAEVCRHDGVFASGIEHSLINAAFFSREAVRTRERDIDRRTQQMLRGTFDKGRISITDRSSLAGPKAFLISGPYGLAIRMVLDKGLSNREKNAMMLHFLGVIVTHNLEDNGIHEEPGQDQTEADEAARSWSQHVVRELVVGKSKNTVFVKGLERALAV